MERVSDDRLRAELLDIETGDPDADEVTLERSVVLSILTELLEHRDLERANDELLAMSLHAMGDE